MIITSTYHVLVKSNNLLYYRVLSEFMLQQTQVKTVIPYFKLFTKNLDPSSHYQKLRAKGFKIMGGFRILQKSQKSFSYI